MFQTLGEAIQQYQNRYQDTNDDWRKIKVPGASLEEIEAIEKKFNTPIHPTLKTVLQKIAWASFTNLYLDGLEGLFIMDRPGAWAVPLPRPDYYGIWDTPYWYLGGSDGYFIFMEIDSGIIRTADTSWPGPFEQAANNIDEFICIAATIVMRDWPNPEESQEQALAEVDTFLDKHSIKYGRKFWRNLAMGWA